MNHTALLSSCSLLFLLSAHSLPTFADSPPTTATPESVKVESAPAATTPPAALFGFADVQRRASEWAKQPYQPKDATPLPESLEKMNYDQYRDIRFRPEKALWLDEKAPFALRFFHRGFLFNKQVKVNIIDKNAVMTLNYSPDFFNYGKNQVGELPTDLGFAGFQVIHPYHSQEVYDEITVFLGASYFRAVGKGQWYGISARGLAIDTGLPKREEFPYFREFWIEKPEKEAKTLTIYALLDSPSVSGAYRFILSPEENMQIEVKTSLYFRNSVEQLGIAPLTSMFYKGENLERFRNGVRTEIDDFRPEVHDSDGLLMQTGANEMIWRPLNNPQFLRINTYSDNNPKGFGLIQRDRDFNNYQDLEARYHRRPSLWVQPIGDWGKGTVRLVEIPTDAERNDNIAAFWTPEENIKAGDEKTYEYRLHFMLNDSRLQPNGGQSISTRVGRGGAESLDEHRRKFAVDFVGKVFGKVPEDGKVDAEVTASSGKILNTFVQHNPATGGWRLYFELEFDDKKTVDLRAFLKYGQDVLTETWSYQWNNLK